MDTRQVMQMLEIRSEFLQHFLDKTLGILHHVNVVNFVPRLNEFQKVAGKGNDYKMWLHTVLLTLYSSLHLPVNFNYGFFNL